MQPPRASWSATWFASATRRERRAALRTPRRRACRRGCRGAGRRRSRGASRWSSAPAATASTASPARSASRSAPWPASSNRPMRRRTGAPAAQSPQRPPTHKEPVPMPKPSPDSDKPPQRWLELAGYLALGVLLLLAVPLFLCMPMWSDVTHYDLGAWIVLRGGVYYRDLGDFNLPGMVWGHVGLRWRLCWDDELLRLVDLLVVGGNVDLLVHWLRLVGLGPAARAWTAVLLALFYFSTTESAHCQRDMWMLLPCLAALHLRYHQVE